VVMMLSAGLGTEGHYSPALQLKALSRAGSLPHWNAFSLWEILWL